MLFVIDGHLSLFTCAGPKPIHETATLHQKANTGSTRCWLAHLFGSNDKVKAQAPPNRCIDVKRCSTLAATSWSKHERSTDIDRPRCPRTAPELQPRL